MMKLPRQTVALLIEGWFYSKMSVEFYDFQTIYSLHLLLRDIFSFHMSGILTQDQPELLTLIEP